MSTSPPPDPIDADALSRHLAAFDAALIGDLPEALVRDELADLGLDASRLRWPGATGAEAGRRSTVDRASQPRGRAGMPRWRTGVLAALGLLALVMASVAVLRSARLDTVSADTEIKSSDAPAQTQGPTPADTIEASRDRLSAVAASPADTLGAGAAISVVRRAYQESRQFEAVAGAPLDSALASAHLARLLHDAYLALGQPDSAARYRP